MKEKTRDHVDGHGRKHREEEIQRKKCPRCGHGKAWLPRGDRDPKYVRKCTRCGHWEV